MVKKTEGGQRKEKFKEPKKVKVTLG
uniref:Uncharacterized protein n=1 Tax=Tetranychus urticae TaxID=32264 RepID=T1JSK8_TETUR